MATESDRQVFAAASSRIDQYAVGSYCSYQFSEPSLLQTPPFSISLDTPSDPSPMPPEQSNPHTEPSNHWMISPNEYFPTNVPVSHPSSAAFTYGNWEEWMRWDGVAESMSPSQLHTSPPAYRRNKVVSSAQHEPMLSPGMTGQETSISETPGSLDQVSMSGMDISPFSFGYNDSHQADFRFSDAMNSARDQASPRDYSFRPEVVHWDTPPQISPMTVEEHKHLRNIALQRTSSYGSHQSFGSAGSVNRAVSASPEPTRSSSIGKKRKSSGEDSIPPVGEGPIKKSAHNMIEKRYRTNLNDKISQLRDSVPSLRGMPKSAAGAIECDEDREDLEGLVPTHKMNKATILSKATEYIQYLSRANKRLEDENSLLKSRIRAFEKLAVAGSIGTSVNAGGTSIPPRIQGPPFVDGGIDDYQEASRRAHSASLHRPNWLSQLPARPITGD